MKSSPKIRKGLLTTFLWFFVPLVLVLLFSGVAFENRRGAGAWEAAQERAGKEGVSLLRAGYAGEGIPDEENLLKNKVFLKEFENEGEDRLVPWRKLPELIRHNRSSSNPAIGEVLQYSGYFDEELSEEAARERLAAAAADFDNRLDKLTQVILATPVHPIFAKSASERPLFEIAENLGAISKISGCMKSSVMMALRSGESKKALERMKALDRWGESIGSPSLVHYLMGNATRALNLRLVWDGLRLRVWTDEELEIISNILEKWDNQKIFIGAIQFEVAFGLESQESSELKRTYLLDSGEDPDLADRFSYWWNYEGLSGWREERKALLVNKYLDLIEKVKTGEPGNDDELMDDLDVGQLSPMNATSRALRGVVATLYGSYQRSEMQRRIALIAIASERHYLAHQSYPQALSDLDIEIPVIDLTDSMGRELVYELGPEGRPIVYSKAEEETVKKVSKRQLRWQFHQVR